MAAERSTRAVAQEVYSAASAHPAEDIQKNWLRNELETKHFAMANLYGAQLPMQIRMECDILAQSARLPGMPTHNVGLECILNRDETMDFEDFLGTPDMCEYTIDMRAQLEKKYGLGPRSMLAGRVGGPKKSVEPPRAGVAAARELGLF